MGSVHKSFRIAIALYKIWHEVYEFQGSLLGVNFSPEGVEPRHKYFVNFKGQVLSNIDFYVLQTLLLCAQNESYFIANMIDIALDFPVPNPRLSEHLWEVFVEDGLLFNYRTVRRISNFGFQRNGQTVYLGSRESERFVRIYDKTIGDIDYDRLEVEFKRSQALYIMQHMRFLPKKKYCFFE